MYMVVGTVILVQKITHTGELNPHSECSECRNMVVVGTHTVNGIHAVNTVNVATWWWGRMQ